MMILVVVTEDNVFGCYYDAQRKPMIMMMKWRKEGGYCDKNGDGGVLVSIIVKNSSSNSKEFGKESETVVE